MLSVITANMQVVTDDGYDGAVIDGSVHPAAVLLGQGDGGHAPATSRRTGYIPYVSYPQSHTSHNHHRKPP
jgi:hypothetical protein